MRRFGLAIGIMLIVGVTTLFARTWTDNTGKHKIEADFVKLEAETVHLKKSDGKIVKMPLLKLSEADQVFAKEQAGGTPVAAPSVATNTVTPAVSSATAEGVTVEVIGVSVVKPLPEIKSDSDDGVMMMSGGFNSPGTRFGLLVTDSSRQVVGIDEAKSKIAVSDDTGGNLSKAAKKQPDFMSDRPLHFDARRDGRSGIVEVTQPGTPAAGASRIRIKGELHVQCGVGEKTDEQKGVALKEGTQITIAQLPMKIENVQEQDFGEMKMMVSISTNKPFTGVKKIIFATADGKEIPSQETSSGNFGFGSEKTYSRSYALKEKVDSVTIRVVGYEKLDMVKVPLDLAVGVGF